MNGNRFLALRFLSFKILSCGTQACLLRHTYNHSNCGLAKRLLSMMAMKARWLVRDSYLNAADSYYL